MRCKHEWWAVTGSGMYFIGRSNERQGQRWCKCCGALKNVNSFGVFMQHPKPQKDTK